MAFTGKISSNGGGSGGLNLYSKGFTIGGFGQDFELNTGISENWTIVKVAFTVTATMPVSGQIRTAAGGGGTALSGAHSFGTAGYFNDYTTTSVSYRSAINGDHIWLRVDGAGLGVSGVVEIFYTTS